MGFLGNVFDNITKPRPRFRKGDKVQHKLNNKIYIVIDWKEEDTNKFVYLCKNEKEETKIEQEMLKFVRDTSEKSQMSW